MEILKKHHGRLLLPEKDLQVIKPKASESTEFQAEDSMAVVLLDGLNMENFNLEEEDYEVSESEDEEMTEEQKEALRKEKEQKEAEEAAKKAAREPQMYNCVACTMENLIGNGACEICGTPRPSMEEIKAAQGIVDAEPEEEKVGDEEGNPKKPQ